MRGGGAGEEPKCDKRNTVERRREGEEGERWMERRE